MKRLLVTLLAMNLLSCDDDGISNDQPGCVTGIHINDDTNTRVNIGCGTQEQYNNFAILRVDYIDLKWEAVDSCNECR